MYSQHKKNQLEAAEAQKEGLRRLHYGRSHDNQRTMDVLKEGREVRDTKAPLAQSRFSDWVTSRIGTGEIQPCERKPKTVHDHTFRDRVKMAEVGERAFGVYYEKEKERIERKVDEYTTNHLQREAWFKNQSAPVSGVRDAGTGSARKQTGTALKVRHFTDAERINAAVENSSFDMHAGHGWKQLKMPEFRPKVRKNFGGENVTRFDHGSEDFVWAPPISPNSTVEPYRDMGKKHEQTADDPPLSQKRQGESKTRFDFNSKEDGPSRMNFQMHTPRPKPEPTMRVKRYNNSLKGVTCFLPHSMTADFEGHGEIQRQAKSIVAGI